MRMKIKLLVLFLEYEQEEYRGAFEKLKSFVDPILFCDKTYIIIDNKQEKAPVSQESAQVYYVGGDNSCREFSGWQKGLEAAHKLGLNYDILLVANNSFLANGKSFLEDHASVFLLLKSIVGQKVIGKVDNCQEEMQVYDYRFHDWVCTNCFFIPKKIMMKLNSFVSVDEKKLNHFLSRQFRDFKKNLVKTVVQEEDVKGGRFSIDLQLPKDSSFDLQIELDKVYVPCEQGMSADVRELGLMVREMTIDGVNVDMTLLEKGGYDVDDGNIWIGRSSTFPVQTLSEGLLHIDCFIHDHIFRGIHGNELEMTISEVESFFYRDAPLSKRYQTYIVDWLTHGWHSKYLIDENNWENTQGKICCILNEILLTARIREKGFMTVNY